MGCEWLLVNCYLYPGTKWFIGREELKRLMTSTYQTWIKVCSYHNIPRSDWKLNGQYNYIEFIGGAAKGSRIDLIDVKEIPSDPLYERFGSTEYTSGWLEEAGEIAFKAFDVLKTRVGRHLNREYNIPSKILITCNPKKNWLYQIIYKPFKENRLPAEYAFIQALYGDNKFTADEYAQNLSNIADRATKERLMYGNWEYDDDPNALMNYDALVDIFTNHVVEGNKYITADIARYGQDKTVIYLWKGLLVDKIIEIPRSGLDHVIETIKQLAEQEMIPRSRIIVDEDGVGGGVVDVMKGIKGFVNNSTPLANPVTHTQENYRNLKTQCYYLLAQKVNNHEIAIRNYSEDFKATLIEELEQVKSKDLDKDTKLMIVPKEEVKELLGRSPDYSDALMMRMWFELKPASTGVKQHIPNNIVRLIRPNLNAA
jgi:phage terminase large subunit